MQYYYNHGIPYIILITVIIKSVIKPFLEHFWALDKGTETNVDKR